MTMGAPPPNSEEELERLLSEPTGGVLETIRKTEGDIIVLGAGGKMGPTLARMARRALDAVRPKDRVIAVSRFSSAEAAHRLRASSVETITCDLTDRAAVAELPDAPNVIFMAGQKFGTSDAPGATWMMNAVVPSIVAERYGKSRIVAFSTGNVYPFVPVASGGSTEDDPVGPVGEYAASCLARERILTYHSERAQTPMAIVRLNYAVELRYGVLVDVARKVHAGEPVDVGMGYFNVIWQGDACARAIECLPHASSPPFILNVTGTQTLSTRSIADYFANVLGKPAVIEGVEDEDALLSNAARMAELMGEPEVSVGQMMVWIADWIQRGRPLLDKPTHFEERGGRF
ncbi:MAG TPA: NAD-dependent epimerase/dehydratase family protein [Gemmatimonadaceae bacterium]